MWWVMGERSRGIRFVWMGEVVGLRRAGGEIGVLVVRGGLVRLMANVMDGEVESLSVSAWRE